MDGGDTSASAGVQFRYDEAAHLRIATFQGRMRDEHLLRDYAALLQDPAFDPTFDDLVDLRGADLQISAGALWKLIGLLAPIDSLGIHTRVAVVAVRPLAYGLARMYELIRSSSPGATEEIRVFKDAEAARTWVTGG